MSREDEVLGAGENAKAPMLDDLKRLAGALTTNKKPPTCAWESAPLSAGGQSISQKDEHWINKISEVTSMPLLPGVPWGMKRIAA